MSGDGAGELVVCLSTAPDAEEAERIARALLDERLIACANLLPGVVSLFRWEGAVQREAEVVMLIKTRRSLVRRLEERLAELHPYEVPELLVVGVEDALPAYRRWMLEQT